MIEVTLEIFGEEYAIVRMDDLLDNPSTDHGNYRVDVAIRGEQEDSLFRRTLLDVDKLTTNPLGLLRAALATLPEEAFHGKAFPPNMARRQSGPMPAFQAWTDQLHHHRSALRSGQPVEHGGDEVGEGARPEDRG